MSTLDKITFNAKKININTNYKRNFIGINEITKLIDEAIKNNKKKIKIPSKKLRNVDAQTLIDKGFIIKKHKNPLKNIFIIKWKPYNNIHVEEINKLKVRVDELTIKFIKLHKKTDEILNAITSLKK